MTGSTCIGEHVGFEPSVMGRGIGRQVLRKALGLGQQSERITFRAESDPNATGFYERMGARRAAQGVTLLESQTRGLPILELDPS